MSQVLTPVNTASDVFSVPLSRINDLIAALANNVVTANSAVAGGLTVGNAYVSGIFGGTTLVANTIQGGLVNVLTALNLGSNLVAVNNSINIIAGNVNINTTALAVGANAVLNTSALFVGNSTVNIVVNSSYLAIGPTHLANSSTLFVGNSTVNAIFTSSLETISNTTQTVWLGPGYISVGNSTINLTINSTTSFSVSNLNFGNSTVNLVANSITLIISNPTSISSVNAGAHQVGANVTLGVTGLGVGNTVANLTVNSTNILVVNATANLNIFPNQLVVANSLVKAEITPANIMFSNSTGGFGSGSMALGNTNLTFPDLTQQTTAYVPQNLAFMSLTDAATIAVDMGNGANLNFVVTLAGNRTLGYPTNVPVGQSGLFKIIQDATGSRLLSYTGGWTTVPGYRTDGDGGFLIGTTPNKCSYISWTAITATSILLSLVAVNVTP